VEIFALATGTECGHPPGTVGWLCFSLYPLCSDFMGGKTWHFEDPIFAIFAKIA